MLSVSHEMALGKDSVLFFKVAAYLWFFSFVGSFTDFRTLAYTSKFHFTHLLSSDVEV